MEDGDVVEINYVGRIKNTGEVFDLTDPDVAEEEDIDTSSMDLGPVKILLGEEYVLEGLEDAIRDMNVGDEETVEVPKDKAFGSRTSDNIETVARGEFDNHDVTPRRGMPVEIDGRRGKILTASSGRVKVDFNHPLAGRDLEYDIEILEQVEDTEERVKAVVDFHANFDYETEVDDGQVRIVFEEDAPDALGEHLPDEIEKLDDVDDAEVTVRSGEDDEDTA